MSARQKSGFRELFAVYAPYKGDVLKGLFFLFFQHAYVWLSPIFIARLIDLPGSDPATRTHRFAAYGSAMLALILLNYRSITGSAPYLRRTPFHDVLQPFMGPDSQKTVGIPSPSSLECVLEGETILLRLT